MFSFSMITERRRSESGCAQQLLLDVLNLQHPPVIPGLTYIVNIIVTNHYQGNCYKREHDGNTLYNSYYQVNIFCECQHFSDY